jgi:hypothetical protein
MAIQRIIKVSDYELRMIIALLEYRAGQKRDYIRANRFEISEREQKSQLEQSREYEDLAHELEEGNRDE